MLDICGVFLFIGSLVGVIKGSDLPLWIPQAVVIISLSLLIYQGVFKHSRFIFIHSGTFYMALIWIAGHMLEASWGTGILTQLSIWILLLATPLAAFAPQQAQKRFHPAAGKRLELTRTETSPFKEWWLSQKRKTVISKAKSQSMELIVFDLGEEIDFQNK